MIESKDGKVGGMVVWWNTGRFVRLKDIKDGLDLLGKGKFAPSARTGPAALRSALEEVFPSKVFRVEPLARKDAFEVVCIERGEERNTFAHYRWVGIDKDLQVEVKPFEMDVAERIVCAFNKHLGLVTANDVTNCLTGILAGMGAVSPKNKGGMYWLPDSRYAEWKAVCDVIEAADAGKHTTNRCYTLRHRMDEDAVRAVRDAIVREIVQETEAIHKEVLDGDLGERALNHRMKEANAMREKIAVYEGLLDCGLSNLRESLAKAEEAVCAARLISSGTPVAV